MTRNRFVPRSVIRRARGKVWRCLDSVKAFREFNLHYGGKAFLIGTPEHTNIGDSAITIAETLFLGQVLGHDSQVRELTLREYERYHKLVGVAFTPHMAFFWHGGGNMGDTWFNEELFRREFIVQQKNHRPVVFPQTIDYSDTEKGRVEEANSVSVYNDDRITIVARESESYRIMRELYPFAQVLLTPDIVLSATMADFGAVQQLRSGVLFCVRSDVEKSVDDATWTLLRMYFEVQGIEVRNTDMYSDVAVTKVNRAECVRKKMQEFCAAKLVVTDRLHGMVFSALTGTPCIVFSNYNHKVKGTYEWISYLEYVKYVESAEEAIACASELLGMGKCEFDNTPLLPYFDELAKVVRERVIQEDGFFE